MRAAIVLGGDLCKSEKAVQLLKAAQLCIAADSGADDWREHLSRTLSA